MSRPVKPAPPSEIRMPSKPAFEMKRAESMKPRANHVANPETTAAHTLSRTTSLPSSACHSINIPIPFVAPDSVPEERNFKTLADFPAATFQNLVASTPNAAPRASLAPETVPRYGDPCASVLNPFSQSDSHDFSAYSIVGSPRPSFDERRFSEVDIPVFPDSPQKQSVSGFGSALKDTAVELGVSPRAVAAVQEREPTNRHKQAKFASPPTVQPQTSGSQPLQPPGPQIQMTQSPLSQQKNSSTSQLRQLISRPLDSQVRRIMRGDSQQSLIGHSGQAPFSIVLVHDQQKLPLQGPRTLSVLELMALVPPNFCDGFLDYDFFRYRGRTLEEVSQTVFELDVAQNSLLEIERTNFCGRVLATFFLAWHFRRLVFSLPPRALLHALTRELLGVGLLAAVLSVAAFSALHTDLSVAVASTSDVLMAAYYACCTIMFGSAIQSVFAALVLFFGMNMRSELQSPYWVFRTRYVLGLPFLLLCVSLSTSIAMLLLFAQLKASWSVQVITYIIAGMTVLFGPAVIMFSASHTPTLVGSPSLQYPTAVPQVSHPPDTLSASPSRGALLDGSPSASPRV